MRANPLNLLGWISWKRLLKVKKKKKRRRRRRIDGKEKEEGGMQVEEPLQHGKQGGWHIPLRIPITKTQR